MLFKTKHHFRALENRITGRVIAANLEHFFEQSARSSTASGVTAHDPADPHPELIVSLTTFPPRIPDVYKVVESLLQQSLRPARVLLWIARDDLEARHEPRLLKQQTERGLEIRYCDEDLRSYKKLLFTLREFPQARIVTVDDDTLYPVDFLEKLDRAYRDQPDVVHCHRARLMDIGPQGTPRPYKQWKVYGDDGRVGFQVFPIGVGGVLYPPGCFADGIQDVDTLRRICPTADDVWFKVMTLRNQVKCRRIPSTHAFSDRFLTVGGSQRVALKRINKKAATGNYAQIKKTFAHFGLSVPID